MDRNGQQQYSSYNVYTLCATGNLGSKVYQKNILNTITPTSSSLNCWYLAGWIHAFTFFTPNCYPTIAMLQQQSMLGRPVSIFLVSVPVSYFDQPVWIAGSISFFFFIAPNVVWYPSFLRFHASCSEMFFHKSWLYEWLSELLQCSYQLKAV